MEDIKKRAEEWILELASDDLNNNRSKGNIARNSTEVIESLLTALSTAEKEAAELREERDHFKRKYEITCQGYDAAKKNHAAKIQEIIEICEGYHQRDPVHNIANAIKQAIEEKYSP